MRKILACTLAVLSALTAFGGPSTDSVKVYFRIGDSRFEPSLGENGTLMESFINKVCMANKTHELEGIVVRAYASPDGDNAVNKRLTVKRCDVMVRYIIDHTGIPRNAIRTEAEGVAWNELRQLVNDTPEVPSREKVLDILNNTPVWIFDTKGRVIDGRKKQLMSLDKGTPYRWMYSHLFPILRNAVAVSFYLKPTDDEVNNGASTQDERSEHKDIPEQAVSKETIQIMQPSESEDSLHLTSYSDIHEETRTPVASENKVKSTPANYQLALKTNFLYYAALMPNLEMEWMFHPKWSAALEGNIAWYANFGNRTYQLAIVSPEVRYWALSRKPWHGMYVGVFGGVGLYDFMNGGEGYQGEGATAGISVGYMWPISSSWSLEAGIGGGYMHTRYKVYEPRDGHFLYMRTKTLDYFGPLKLRFSIVWRFLDKNRSKTKNRQNEE